MDNTKQTRILAISMSGPKIFQAYAAWSGEMLVILEIKTFIGGLRKWRAALEKNICEKRDNGYIVVIEEKTDILKRFAASIDFEAVNPLENRINLYAALDYYFAMLHTQHIVFSRKEMERFRLTSEKVDIEHDEKGRKRYLVDWRTFDGGHKVLLLCVMAAIQEPVSEQWIHQFYTETPQKEETVHSFLKNRIKGIING